MAKNTRPTPRRQKQQPRTIDLEANETSSERESDPDSSKLKADTGESAGQEASDRSQAAKDETEGDAGSASTPPPASKKSGTSFSGMLLSAVLGGGVALGGASLLGNSQIPVIGGLFGNQDNEAQSALVDANARIDQLTKRLEDLSASQASNDTSELATRMDEIESQISGLVGSEGGAVNNEAVSEALAAAKAADEKAQAAAAQLEVLNARILENAGGSEVDMEAVKAALSAESNALAERLAGLEASLGDVQSAENSANGEALKELHSEISVLSDELEKLSGLPQQIEALSQSSLQKSGEVAEQMVALETRLGGLEADVRDKILPSMNEVEKAASAAVESQKVARSVSARALSSALEQGGKFSGELASAEALIGPGETIDQLKSLAASGVKTQAELLAGFEDVADQILSARPSDEGEGILNRFMASAKSLVQVRPAGPIEGDSNGAVLSRMGAQLEAGELEAVKREWEGLDEAAKAVSSNWIGSVDERIKAKSLIETVISELTASENGEG